MVARQRAEVAVQENLDVMKMKKQKNLMKIKLELLGNQGTYLNN